MRVFGKITVISGFWTVFAAGSLLGCAELKSGWMWLDGYHTKTCDESEYVGARVQNLSSTKVDFQLCSPDRLTPVVQQSLQPFSEIKEFQTVTESKIREQTFDRAESCASKGLVPDKVGDQVPFLNNEDQQNLKICLNPEFSVPYDRPWITPTTMVKVYFIVADTQSCPENAAPFDPSTVTCL